MSSHHAITIRYHYYYRHFIKALFFVCLSVYSSSTSPYHLSTLFFRKSLFSSVLHVHILYYFLLILILDSVSLYFFPFHSIYSTRFQCQWNETLLFVFGKHTFSFKCYGLSTVVYAKDERGNENVIKKYIVERVFRWSVRKKLAFYVLMTLDLKATQWLEFISVFCLLRTINLEIFSNKWLTFIVLIHIRIFVQFVYMKQLICLWLELISTRVGSKLRSTMQQWWWWIEDSWRVVIRKVQGYWTVKC